MFEGETTIKFSKEAGMLMMSQNVSDMFKMPLEVTVMDMTYSGLEVTFGPPKAAKKDPFPLTEPNGEPGQPDPEEVAETEEKGEG